MGRSLARPCARTCARTSDILLVNREFEDFALKDRFPLVKSLSRDFRYFGDKGLADYGDDFPIIRRAVKELGRSHRVHHRAVLRNQFLDLKSKIWRKYKRMRIGEPIHKDTTKRCNGGGGGICTL
jgi:hypothetical protein